MAYNAAIPQPGDKLNVSQADLLNNFIAINTFVGTNHYGFGDPNQGKHLYLQMPEHAAPATAVNEAGLYANVGSTSTVTELFFRRENNGASIAFTEGVFATAGWTMLPSGMILQWGHETAAGASQTFALTKAFPTLGFSIVATPNALPAGLNTDIIIAVALVVAAPCTQFTVTRKTHFGTPVSFNYFAIGY